MRRITSYELVVEAVDEVGDILEVIHADINEIASLHEMLTEARESDGAVTAHAAVTRTIGNDVEGIVDRGYWYFVGAPGFGGNDFEPPKHIARSVAEYLSVAP